MNKTYIDTLVEYIDLSDCSFQYTLDWYNENGFQVCNDMMFVNRSTPACRINDTAYPPLDQDYLDIFLELTVHTTRQLDWVIANWQDGFWWALSQNDDMTPDKWRRILQHRAVPDEWLDYLLSHPLFPWTDLQEQCERIGMQVRYFVTTSRYIVDPARSAYNDWFWEGYRNEMTVGSARFLSGNPTVSPGFWKSRLDLLDVDEASANPAFDEFFWRRMILRNPCAINWYQLSSHPRLPVEFWDEHRDRIHWGPLCMHNQVLTLPFLMRNLESIEWTELCFNEHAPSEFWEAYCSTHASALTKLDWSSLCCNASVPPEFLAECLTRHNSAGELVDWYPQSTRCPLAFWEGGDDVGNKSDDDRRYLYRNPYVLELVMKRELSQFLGTQ